MAMVATKTRTPASKDSKVLVSFEADERHYSVPRKHAVECAITEKLGVHCYFGNISKTLYFSIDEKNTYSIVKLPAELNEILNTKPDILPHRFSLYIPTKMIPVINNAGKFRATPEVNELIYKLSPPPWKGDKFKWIDNGWISNMAPLENPIKANKLEFWTVENFYQAMKSDDKYVQEMFARESPEYAKKYWDRMFHQMRKDWPSIGKQVMYRGLWHKFMNNPYFRQKLSDSYPFPIIEFNNWNDSFWGVYIKTWEGSNVLGQMIMSIRDKLFSKIPF